ncbi:DUF4390 domain-containing protein [Desulfovibrio ferrophilus]|uniref:DUF4390 domain-containing protein n=1 Tax=Desulfovibrio ferrophilus TaxID=241368 RepID=A0A2Z6AVN8_9BACT|nr:DUF4390 domain-containing protein [Desulfovibrio ferrophilus]BBD07304.1 uncharacterized protein DFE_0578 [Desulfovibrio ferrophilus]
MHRTGLINTIPKAGRLWTLCVLLCAVALSAGLAPARCQAGELELGSLILDNQEGNISVRFGVRMSGLDELRKELDAGTTVVLNCDASVSRRGRMWLDTRLAETEWSSTVSKDVLADEYRLQLPGEESPRRGKDLAALLIGAWGGLTLDLGSWEALTPGYDYQLKLDISLDRTDVPVWLRYVVFFWSFDVYPPTSYQLDFTY